MSLVSGQNIEVASFIDSDSSKVGSFTSGIEVVAPADIPANGFVLVASVHAEAIMRDLKQLGKVVGRDFDNVDFCLVEAFESRAQQVEKATE